MLKNLIALKNPKSRTAEAYRTLRTNIQFSALDEEIKVIVVTSTGPGEGKSTVMSNLAIVTAQAGQKVLLIDCDLRKPTVYKKLGLSNKAGLTNVLSQGKKIEECIQLTDLDNFYVLTSGPIPPNPAELLGSKKMKNLIKELSQVFDKVFIDAPPVLAVTDAQILSTMSQGVILVAAYGETDKDGIVKAKELLEKVDAKILGVVLNKVPEVSKEYYYGKYHYNYTYK